MVTRCCSWQFESKSQQSAQTLLGLEGVSGGRFSHATGPQQWHYVPVLHQSYLKCQFAKFIRLRLRSIYIGLSGYTTKKFLAFSRSSAEDGSGSGVRPPEGKGPARGEISSGESSSSGAKGAGAKSGGFGALLGSGGGHWKTPECGCNVDAGKNAA